MKKVYKDVCNKIVSKSIDDGKIKLPIDKKDLLFSVFETIFKLVWSDGGDGCGFIYCKNIDYKEVSNIYKDWLKNYHVKYKLIKGKDYCLWTDKSNENFFFTSNKQKVIDELNNKISDSYIITI